MDYGKRVGSRLEIQRLMHFAGKFEGNGFTISNLKIDRSVTNDYVGLFSIVGQEAEITNVGLLDVDITGG